METSIIKSLCSVISTDKIDFSQSVINSHLNSLCFPLCKTGKEDWFPYFFSLSVHISILNTG